MRTFGPSLAEEHRKDVLQRFEQLFACTVNGLSIKAPTLEALPWGGLLRLHGQDIARLQRLLDPLLTLLFVERNQAVVGWAVMAGCLSGFWCL